MEQQRGSGLSQPDSLQAQVTRNIRNDIEAGVLRHGQTLPSTRALAERWQVSVFTINEAMRTLSADGLVISKSRSHRVVNAPDQEERSLAKPTRPSVVIIGGFAGSGKSELGRVMARMTCWPILDKDTTTRPVVERALEVLGMPSYDRESETYLSEIRPREYEAILATAIENVECGLSVIVTAPFVREFSNSAWIERTRARFDALGASVVLVWVHCDQDTMLTYIRHRGAARDTAKLADWATYAAQIQDDFRPESPHHVVDNSASSKPLQEQARALIASIVAAATP